MTYLQGNFLRVALALYLDMKPSEIQPSADLRRDLGLEPLDLALIVYRLEEFADAELSMSQLDRVVTVADFERVLRDWSRDAPADEPGESDEPPPIASDGQRSGVHALPSAKVRAAR